MLILKSGGIAARLQRPSLAIHLAGSQYMTWLSLSDVRTRIAGYGRGPRFVYGQ